MATHAGPVPPVPHGATPGGRKWLMLAIVSLGFIVMTINWFNIAAAFPQIGKQLNLGIPKLALLISAFLAGYGIFHIPGGFLATRLGLRTVLVLGLGAEGLGAILSTVASGYAQLVTFRLIAGIGASVFAGIGVAAVSVWFQEKYLALALGVVSADFSLGAALGLYAWSYVIASIGWRGALAIGGGLCLLISALLAFAFKSPPGKERLAGVRLTRQAVRQTLGNNQLWLYGVAFLGAYGAFFAASQMIGEFGANALRLSAGQIALAALLVGIAGIPGSILGGWLSDRFARRRPFLLAVCLLEGLFLLSIPIIPPGLLWLSAAGVGFMFNCGFALWNCVPGDSPEVDPENIGTAIGLMLTLAAVGGFLLPFGFGRIVPAFGYASAWVFLGAVTVLFAAVILATREPGRVAAVAPSPERAPVPSHLLEEERHR